MLGRFHGWLSHLILSGASWALWVHRDVAGPAMEVGTIQGSDDLKAICNILNGWHVVVFALRQASHTNLVAEWAS